MKPLRWITLILATIVSCAAAFGGGPILVGGPTIGVDGAPFVWDNSKPIAYRVDGGPLGSVSHDTAVSMVSTAFSRWSDISTAKLSFTSLGAITGIPGGNVKTVSDFEKVYSSCASGTQSPIVFDDDDSLLLSLTGDSGVVGLTGLCTVNNSGHIVSAFSIIGNPSGLTTAQLQAVMVHEFGHFLGLDHTDVRVPLSTGTTVADINNTPTMYFFLETDKQQTPKLDDKVWISKFYPSASYSTTYGMIRGTVLFTGGTYPVQDFLMVAREINDIHATVVGNISGYRFTGNLGQPYTADYLPCSPANACPPNGMYGNNASGSRFGSRDVSLLGTFEIPLPPGDYVLEFQGGGDGKIGPINPQLYPPGQIGYWPTDTYSGAAHITVKAGETVDGIQAVLVGTPPAFDVFDQPASASTPAPQSVRRSGGDQ